MNTAIVQELLKRNLFIIVLGALLLILGAADTITIFSFSLQISDTLSKSMVRIVGIVFIVIGIIEYYLTKSPTAPMTFTTIIRRLIESVGNRRKFVGEYRIDETKNTVIVSHLGRNLYGLEQRDLWDGCGIYDGKVYLGMYKYKEGVRTANCSGLWGFLRAELQSDGSFEVYATDGTKVKSDCRLTWNKNAKGITVQR